MKNADHLEIYVSAPAVTGSIIIIGWNYRFTNLQAAIGLVN